MTTRASGRTRDARGVLDPIVESVAHAQLAIVLLMLPLLADAAGAQVVINEIDYDQVGTDIAEFIELKNTGFTPVNLDTFSIRLINGGAPIPGRTTPAD